MNWFNLLLARSLPLFPRGLIWRAARRYIAGLSVEEAFQTVQALSRQGMKATLDILGEDVFEARNARAACDAYCRLIARVAGENLPSGISIKLSQLGARFSEESAFQLAEEVVRCAQPRGRFVRIDMEDSSLTALTLSIYQRLAWKYPNVGVALQAYLRRSAGDLDVLLPLRPDIRLCKGIYVEPESKAFKDPEEIRANFLLLLDRLLSCGGRVAVATHDPILVEEALERLRRLGPERDRHEFQMLLGVGEALRPRLLDEGCRLRIYVPFGPKWHAYSLRRLRENPRLARYVLKDFLRWPAR
ncbi:MAG: proline dehydrogenase family protein [Planctomycetes bacterium]|nr:proline dehydrogenase family protein [Planctomycetota bacterium]